MNNNNILKIMILHILFVGSFIPLSKFAYNRGVDPLNFSYQVMLTASVILFVFSLIKDRRLVAQVNAKILIYLAVVGSIGGGMAHAFFSTGLKLSSAVNCTFVMQSSVFFMPVLSYFLLKEHLKIYKIILIILLLFGVYLISTSGKLLVPQSGDIIILASALSFSIGMVYAKIILKKIPVLTFSAYRALFAGMSIFLYLLFSGKINSDIYWMWILIGGSLISVGTLMTNTIIKNASVSYYSMMSMSVPVVTTILAFLFLGEAMTFAQLIGGCIVVVSGVFVHRAGI